ncbi:MAG TPA: VWA domain-containing protein [Opitutaceae bacterium]|nr:VWA domain-containing protein [Opitutaceae bacterium]
MSFAWPQLLWLLFVPAGWLAWELTHRRRSEASAHPKILRAQAGASSVNLLPANAGVGSMRSKPRVWLTAGIALSIFALARPQWGRLEEAVFDQSREILIAIDLSRSMLAPDVRPSRLERAKLLIQSLLEKLEGERVGLVVFSGTAFLQSPLSADYEILREFLPNLGPEFLPEGGSNYGALIETSLAAFGSTGAADRFLIILSDGEATDEDWKSRVSELKKKSIRTIGLGVGTGAGAMIPDGAGAFIKDDRGAVVLSKLESGTLQELASQTGGIYRDASAWVDLAGLLRQTVEAGQKGKFVEKNTVRLVERFQLPLALGLWCLLVSFCYEFPVKPRPREVKLGTGTGLSKTDAAKVAASVAILLFLGTILFPASGIAADAVPPPPPSLPPAAQLSKMVGRLSTAETHSGRDWAELAGETVTWGQRLQSEQQPVPEGPVRDALAAVDLGSAADAKTADWPKLREDLEALLKKPEDKKDDQQKQQDQQQQNQDQKNEDQKKQDQQKQDQQKQDSQQKSSPDQKSDQQQKQDPSQQPQNEKNEPPKSPESAFGDMKEKPQPPPPPQGDTQKVGGTPEKRPADPAAADPALAQPLQKLEQLRNEDSPAKLFQLMEGERKPPPNKKGKDW